MCDENIEIGVTEITNNILVSAQPTDQIIDINVLEEVENVELTITPSVVEVNIDVTQELITEVVTVDANTCVNIVDVTVTDATDNVTLNITPSLVEVNINRGENNLSIEEYESFADLPTIGDTDTYYITLDDNKFWRWDAIDEVYVEISDSNDKIPYLGAYKNSDLGEWGIKSNWFGLDTTPTNPPNVAGTFTWNDTEGTADLILKGGNVTLQLGQEEVLRVVNKTGATLNEADFRAVRIRSVAEGGAQGQRLAVVLAQGDNDPDSATTIGLVTETIANNQEGFITTGGNVNKINTTGAKSFGAAETWVDGDILYLSPTHAGYLTKVKPQAPNHTVIIGWVVYAHANNGKIFVKVDNGYELDELHNVKITSPTNNQGLIYDSALSVWKNASIQLPLSATSPLSIASNVISISQANATTDGYVSLEDWNYFSAKQQPLFGTGFVKATGSVISYDNTVYTPQSRTLTINGTSYDLSADRSWSISVGSGMRNVSSFVATSGQTTFTIVGGYTAGLVDVFVNGVRLNGGDYTATNGTTVVLSVGAIANDLVDIINYTASLTSGITGSGTTNYLPLWSGSSNLTNSLISQSGTTITANGVFKANGVIASIDGGLYAGSGYQLVFADYGSSEFASIEGSSFSGASSYLRFITNSNERMRITSSGLVGINTSSPRALLDVVGNIYSRDIWIQDGYNLLFGNLTTGASSTYIYGVGGDGVTNYLGFATNGSEKLRITSGGNVGIGASSPIRRLEVASDGSNWISGTFSGTGGTDKVVIGNLAMPTIGAHNSALNAWSNFAVAGVNIIFAPYGSESMRLTDSGILGVGTTSPSTGFGGTINNVKLALRNGTPGQAGGTSVLLIGGDNNHYSYLEAQHTGGGNTYLSFGTSTGAVNPTEKMRITSAGNVGIGTTSPNGLIHAVGSVSSSVTSLQLVQGVGGTSYAQINGAGDASHGIILRGYPTNGTTSDFSVTATDVMSFYEYGGEFRWYKKNGSLSEQMRITSGGSVGIGVTSPSAQLEVRHSSGTGLNISNTTANSYAELRFQSATSSGYIFKGSSGFSAYGGPDSLNIYNEGVIAFYNTTERMRILSDGSVAIGSTTRANVWGLLTLRNTLNSTSQRWGIGPDTNNSLTVYNPSNVGVYIVDGATSWTANSDINLKDIQGYIENAIDSIMGLKAIKFNWKSDSSKNTNIGLIAQEVQKVYPELIDRNTEGYLGVRYTELIPIIIKAIQELNAKLEAK